MSEHRGVNAPNRVPRGDEGAVTVEAAIAIASIVVVLMLCVAAVVAVTLHVRCVDSAREAARLTARGDAAAMATAQRVAPDGAHVQIRTEGDVVVATVRARTPLLPMVRISAEAVAAIEPTAGQAR